MASLSLKSCCPVCSCTTKLRRCQGCTVVRYCGREHQVADRGAHKNACNLVKKARETLDAEERALREAPADFMMPANVFEEAVGNFWGIVGTRDYMRARFGLLDALLKIKTLDAVQAALGHAKEMLRLCRSDNMGIRDMIPALYLRLGRDQECYDFLKWWATAADADHYDWGDPTLPYLDVKDADVFEPVDVFVRKWAPLSHTVAITLLKIKLLFDVKALQDSTVMRNKIPQEIVDNIRSQLVSSVVSGNKEIMLSKDQSELIETLEDQVQELYTKVDESNRYFWDALLSPGKNLTVRPEYSSHGSKNEMQIKLQYNYLSWTETPGAIDMIRELMED